MVPQTQDPVGSRPHQTRVCASTEEVQQAEAGSNLPEVRAVAGKAGAVMVGGEAVEAREAERAVAVWAVAGEVRVVHSAGCLAVASSEAVEEALAVVRVAG